MTVDWTNGHARAPLHCDTLAIVNTMNEMRNHALLMPVLLGLVLVLCSTFGGDALLLKVALRQMSVQSESREQTRAEKLAEAFGALQDYWRQQFSANGELYTDANLILFREAVATPCGNGLIGPFYCPLDGSIYFDLGRHLPMLDPVVQGRDIHQLIVLAHEFGHHVQTLRGIEAETARHKLQHAAAAVALSRQFELQADCIAGMSWRVVAVDGVAEFRLNELFDNATTKRLRSFERGRASVGLSECSLQADDSIQ